MKKLPPSGLDDFGPVAKQGYYIDKTGFIPRLLFHVEGTTTLITRPRRFGKSLMISMLDYFFSLKRKDSAALFSGLSVSNDEYSMSEQGKYPVIRIGFKEAKQNSWSKTYDYIKSSIIDLANSFPELSNSERLSDYQKKEYAKLCNEASSETVFMKSLFRLSELLHVHYGKKAIVLIDEYDAPISKSYSSDYFDEAIEFFRGLYGACLKGNEHLRFAVVSGVMQIAKESLFSDLNNPDIDSVTEGAYSDCYGFTPSELHDLLVYYGFQDQEQEAWAWYGGYRIGGIELANPWSVLKYVERRGILACYWVSTGENAILSKLISSMDEGSTSAFASLVGEGQTTSLVKPSLPYRSLGTNSDDLFSYLLATGYLSFQSEYNPIGKSVLIIPNKEAKVAFESEISSLYTPRSISSSWPEELKKSMKEGDESKVASILSNYVLQSLSSFAYSDWRSYQYLILGMSVALFSGDIVKSEVNTGKGRCDILVFSPEEKYGLIIEIKSSSSRLSSYNLKRLSNSALNQVIKNDYASDLRERGAKIILAIGIGAQQNNAEVSTAKL